MRRGYALALTAVVVLILGGASALASGLVSRGPGNAGDAQSAGAPLALPPVTRVPRTPVLARPASPIGRFVQATDPRTAYLLWLDRTLNSVDDAMAALLDLVEAPDRDTGWALQVTGEVSVWNSAYHNSMAIDPPTELATQHKSVVDGFSQYNQAAGQILQGANDGDDHLVEVGINRAFDGRSEVARARAAMDGGG